MAAAARVSDHVYLLVHPDRVVGDAQIFFFDHEPALQAVVVRRHARGTGILVAAQRLDAPEREHEPARGVDEIGADAQRPRGLRRSDEPARGDDADAAAQTRLDQRVDDAWQSFGDRKGHVVHQRLGRGARAALATVDGEKIRRVLRAAAAYRVTELVDELPAADRGLHAHRLAGKVADQ